MHLAHTLHPPGQRHGLSGIRKSQLTTSICPEHICLLILRFNVQSYPFFMRNSTLDKSFRSYFILFLQKLVYKK